MESNVIFGGIFNIHGSVAYFYNPTILGIVGYNSFTNEIEWESYYCDDVYGYKATALCATKDGGAVVVGLMTTPEQASMWVSDAFVLKFNKKPNSVDVVSSPNSFSCYPNPASNSLTLGFTSSSDGQVHFYDISGRLSKAIDISSVEKSEDISDLRKGIYVLKFYDGKSFIGKQKLIVK